MAWHVCRSNPEALFTWRKQALGHFRSEGATKNMTQLPAGLWTPKPTPTGDRNGGGILEGATAGHADAEQVGRPVSGSRGVTASDGSISCKVRMKVISSEVSRGFQGAPVSLQPLCADGLCLVKIRRVPLSLGFRTALQRLQETAYPSSVFIDPFLTPVALDPAPFHSLLHLSHSPVTSQFAEVLFIQTSKGCGAQLHVWSYRATGKSQLCP